MMYPTTKPLTIETLQNEMLEFARRRILETRLEVSSDLVPTAVTILGSTAHSSLEVVVDEETDEVLYVTDDMAMPLKIYRRADWAECTWRLS